jgi:VanZ family protein
MSIHSQPPQVNPAISAIWRAALVVYWLILATATHVPSDFPGVPSDGWDKLVHFGAFAVLAVLLAAAWQATAGPRTMRHSLSAWIVMIGYAALDEWTQSFVGRDASLFDWLADACGAAAGLAIFAWWWRRSATAADEVP